MRGVQQMQFGATKKKSILVSAQGEEDNENECWVVKRNTIGCRVGHHSLDSEIQKFKFMFYPESRYPI